MMFRKKMKKIKKKSHKILKTLLVLIIILLVLSIASLFFAEPEAEGVTSQIIKDLEIPMITDDDVIIKHEGYTLSYNEDHEIANWVAYTITRDQLFGDNERGDDFRADPKVKTGSATLDDYRGSGYDRGHLKPAASANYSKDAMSETFYMSNMAPQDPSFNRGIWSELEAMVRNFAYDNDLIYVVTGPIIEDGVKYETIGENEVTVPEAFYKVVLDYSEPDIKAIGFILPNEKSKKNVKDFAVSVDEVEKATGIDFFCRLDDDVEEKLERKYRISDWNFTEFSPDFEYDGDGYKPPKNTIGRIIDKVLVMVREQVIDLLDLFLPKDVIHEVENLIA